MIKDHIEAETYDENYDYSIGLKDLTKLAAYAAIGVIAFISALTYWYATNA